MKPGEGKLKLKYLLYKQRMEKSDPHIKPLDFDQFEKLNVFVESVRIESIRAIRRKIGKIIWNHVKKYGL